MQHNDVNVSSIPVDTVLRTYDIKPFEYRVQPYDVLYIKIESLTEAKFDFFNEINTQINASAGPQGLALLGYLVDEVGNIEFPVVGKITVHGLTTSEIERKIQEIAVRYVDDPVVTVRLINFRFTIIGEVNSEGTRNSPASRITLPEAIGLAGGFSELANRSNVKIIRQIGNQAFVSYVDLLDENLLSGPYYYVHQNDVIVVPPLKQRPFRKYFTNNMAIFVSSVTTILFIISLLR